MAVSIGGEGFPNVEPGDDVTSIDAERIARELHAVIGRDACVSAVVHRQDGLILLYNDPASGELIGKHFRCALAGYAGQAPAATAFILSLFGFGAKGNLYVQVSRGGEMAYYSFTK